MTGKEKLFVNAYLLNGFNVTEAARTAKYSNPNANGATVRRQPGVAAEIDARIAEHSMGANEVLARITAHASGDMMDFLDDSGTGLDLAKAKAAHKLGLIKSYSFSRKSGLKIELYDAQGALRDLGRHHKLFTDKVEHGGEVKVVRQDLSKLTPEDLVALEALVSQIEPVDTAVAQ